MLGEFAALGITGASACNTKPSSLLLQQTLSMSVDTRLPSGLGSNGTRNLPKGYSDEFGELVRQARSTVRSAPKHRSRFRPQS